MNPIDSNDEPTFGDAGELLGLLDRFDAAWESVHPPSIDDFLAMNANGDSAIDEKTRRELLIGLIPIDLERRWRRGFDRDQMRPYLSMLRGQPIFCGLPERPFLEDYVERFPTLGTVDDLEAELIGEEYRSRRLWGDIPGLEEYLHRFPRTRLGLRDVLARIDTELAVKRPVPLLPTDEKKPVTARVGEYEILGELGRGSMGVVYKAMHTRLRRLVALKMILSGIHAGREELARFEAEARSVARLQHPNIVLLFEVGEHEGRPFLALELVDGESLARQLESGPLAVSATVSLVETLALAMHHAHQQGVIHRDLKPANVLTTGEGVHKITDFGLAKQLGETADQTQTGIIVGSAAYMAPEQTTGRSGAIGPAADVYALGAILYECLTGRPPFQASTAWDALEMARTLEPVSPRRLQPRIPRDLETICLTCLRKEPLHRYGSAEALANDLQRYKAGRPILARRVGPLRKMSSWCRRYPVVTSLLTMLFLVLTGGILAVARFWWLAEERGRMVERSLKSEQSQRHVAETSLAREGLHSAQSLVRQGRFSEVPVSLDRVPEHRRHWDWEWLASTSKRAPKPIRVLGTHDWGILDVLLSPDGRTVVTSGQDGRIIRWDTDNRVSHELESGSRADLSKHRRHVTGVDDLEDHSPTPEGYADLCWVVPGERFAGASLKNRGVVWDLRTSRQSTVLTHDRPLYAVAASPDGGHLLFGDDRGLILHHKQGQETPNRLALSGGSVLRLAFISPDSWLVGQEDGTIHRVDLEGTRILASDHVKGPIWDLDVTPDGLRVAVASGEPMLLTAEMNRVGSPLFLNTQRTTLPESQDASPETLHAVRFSPDGTHVCAGDNLGRLLLWDLALPTPLFTQWDQHRVMLKGEQLADLPLPLRRRVSAIAFASDGKTAFTGGHNTALREWRLARVSNGKEQFDVGCGARMAFDPMDPDLLWIGTSDGSVSLHDSHDGSKHSGQQGHTGPVTALSVAAQSARAASISDDQTIRLWVRNELRIQPAQLPSIRHVSRLRSVGLSPDGARVAAYDEEDNVLLWDVGSGREIGRASMSDAGPGPVLTGHLAFNADGTRLAAFGPGVSCWIFSTTGLTLVEKAAVVANKGGTALAFSPRDPFRLAGGDNFGRISLHPRSLIGEPPTGLVATTVGLAFSPDGKLLASLSASGEIGLAEVDAIDRTLTLHDEHRNPTAIHFDLTGTRLAVVHRDGQVIIWNAREKEPSIPASVPERTWRETVLLENWSARDLLVRDASLALDSNDRVGMVYMKKSESTDNDRWMVYLGRERDGRFRERLLADLDIPDPDARDGLMRSLSLVAHHDGVIGSYRTPAGGYDGRLIMIGDPPLPSAMERNASSMEVGNQWFDVQAFAEPNGLPSILHFSHHDNTLRWTNWSKTTWDTRIVGQRGDGYRAQAARGDDGRLHALFRSVRFNGDLSPLTYLTSSTDGGSHAEVPDSTVGLFSYSLTLIEGTIPVVLCGCPDDAGNLVVSVARRSGSSWKRVDVLPRSPDAIGAIVSDRRGHVAFAYATDGATRISLAISKEGVWRHELVWKRDRTNPEESPENVRLFTLIDSHDRPVVVALWIGATGARLSVFRTLDDDVR